MAQSPAAPRPLAMATSALRSLRSSTLASSISFFARSPALSTTCPISSRFDIASTESGTAAERPGVRVMLRGPGSAIFSSAIVSSFSCACRSSGCSPPNARSTCSSSR